MASVIVNSPQVSGVIRKNQYTTVWVKPYWSSAWRYVPYLFPQESVESVAPTDSTAVLTWDYGRFLNLWRFAGGTLLPINLQNYFVRIRVHTGYGSFDSWIGRVVGETIHEDGIYTDTGLPRGSQKIECLGLEDLLGRRTIMGTYVGDSSSWAYLSKTREFNSSRSNKESVAGNRSSNINSSAGSYLFGNGKQKWSNLQIAKYLLATFQPWTAVGEIRGVVQYAPMFRIVGQTDALDLIYEQHNLHGMTVRDALNRLIDRKRGFGWHIASTGYGQINIVVFSLSQYNIVGNSAYVPANPRQLNVPIHDDRWIKSTLRVSNLNQVDEIVVESSEPVKTMVTLSYLLGTLEQAWSPLLDSSLDSQDLSYPNMATALYNTPIADADSNGFVSLLEFWAWAQNNSSYFAFLGGLTFGTATIAFGVLDTDGDNWISNEDLEYWLPLETTYQAATEEERATDKYSAVFTQHQVPKTFDWSGWAPYIDDTGKIYPSNTHTGGFWTHDNAFLRYLPLLEPGFSDSAEREYMEPFCVIQKDNPDRDMLLALANYGAAPYTFEQAQAAHPSITQAQFDSFANGVDQIGWEDLYAGLESSPEKYLQLDKAGQVERVDGGDRYPACSMQVGDAGLRIVVRSEANHTFGKNHFDPSLSDIEPVFDYTTMLVTVFVETDVVPRVRIPIYNNIHEVLDKNGVPVTVATRTPQGKQIYIEVPGKEVWLAAPHTVTGLDGESLVYFRGGNSGVIRNDIIDLAYVALVANIWWGQQRASAEFEISNQLKFFAPGDLVLSTVSGWWRESVGTCVTSISRDYQSGTHVVSTGYSEIDPGSMTTSRSR